MPRIQEPPLRERKRLEQKREKVIWHALRDRDKKLENEKRDKKQKKRCVGQLLSMLNLQGIRAGNIRTADTYVPRSYNLDKQLVGLLNHLYVRYPVPAFMYQACLKDEGLFADRQEMFRHWFISLAQGMSFRRLVKGYLTGREAHVFLSAPAGHRIHENVWWAKMRAAGLPDGVTDRLIERLFKHHFIDDWDGRLAEVIPFYARYHGEMNRVTFGEVTDYIAWALNNLPEFRLRGRTISSVVRLTDQWQIQMQKAKLGTRVEWAGLGLPEWLYEQKETIWTVTELRNNRDLLNEGRKQKHCVYSYVHWCSQGHSSIFSMREYRKMVAGHTEDWQVIWDRSSELTRITIEVNSSRSVVQVRGRYNRPPTDDERKVLRLWAGEKGLTVRGY